MAKLLLGLYPPVEGQVLVDGIYLSTVDMASFRRQCGVVVQNSAVFSGSVLDNITLAAPDASLEDVVRAAEIACLHEDIQQMPMGCETLLTEGGQGLSGGQKQRLALARALVTSPQVLLLDDATSHLDTRTEARLHDNLRRLNCTRVVIAHRLSTVRDVDRILVMDDGKVVEQGTHDELMALGGAYADLFETQQQSGQTRTQARQPS